MAISKVVYGNQTLIDLTYDTVDATRLLTGHTAHGSNGELITGTFEEAIPIEVSTEAGMTAVLTAANVGKVYKYIGTTGTYVNGDLYIVEES